MKKATAAIAWLAFNALLFAPAGALSGLQAVRIFVLAGQSNMEGQAVVDLAGEDYNGGRGTLLSLFGDPALEPGVRHLRAPDGSWAVRPDVWCRYVREQGPLLAGPLSVGFTVYGDPHHFGPELQLGHVLGDCLDSQVLLVKTAWGGRSLYRDFRPPRSGGEVGPYYRKMVDQIREATANLKNDFPGCNGEFELAGLVWYHGWNDGVDPATAVPEYEQNLVNLIHDLRDEFGIPDLPVVIGELTGPWIEAPGEWESLRRAQAAAAARPEFQGTVGFVETRNFVRAAEESPNPGHGHHEFGNAETCFLVGDALGKEMCSLLKRKTAPPAAEKGIPATPSQPPSRSEREIGGWKVQIDDRLFEPTHSEVAGPALRFLESRLADIRTVVPAERVRELQSIPIVLDLECGRLSSMQYHPSASWLKANGYPVGLARSVHLPRAADLATVRNIHQQPWVILHELAHGWHDQRLGFDEPRIVAAWEEYCRSGRGEATLLHDGRRVKHYALTNPKEFFAEMSEAWFGFNDFFPFNRAEMMESEPAIHDLMGEIWGTPGDPTGEMRR